MKTCKDLNIKLCAWCNEKCLYNGSCFINFFSINLDGPDADIKNYIMTSITHNFYGEEAMYWFEQTINKLYPQYNDFYTTVLLLK
jgi:hypothetical protein